jgi:hypothetical protein
VTGGWDPSDRPVSWRRRFNSGYQWAPATHTWRGPHYFFLRLAARASRALAPPSSSSLAEELRLRSLLLTTAGARLPTLAAHVLTRAPTGARLANARSFVELRFRPARDLPTLAAHVVAPSPTGAQKTEAETCYSYSRMASTNLPALASLSPLRIIYFVSASAAADAQSEYLMRSRVGSSRAVARIRDPGQSNEAVD